MKIWTVFAIMVATATTAWGQDAPRFAVEAGVLAGVVTPYATVAVVAAPWSVRVSGAKPTNHCSGLQLNVGRVVREDSNAKHTLGAMWGRFMSCQFGDRRTRPTGEYFGLAYDFQAKGFFLEVAPAFGDRNPFLGSYGGRGPLTRVYGQIGYVHRFGKTYE